MIRWPRIIFALAISAAACACGDGGSDFATATSQRDTAALSSSPTAVLAEPTLPTTLAPAQPTPATTPVCASNPILTGLGDVGPVNANGNGIADRINTYATTAGSYLQLVLDERAGVSVQLSRSDVVRVAAIGGYDVDGDGRDEIFAATGNGAYTTWIDVFELDPVACTLVRLAAPGSAPSQFASGASVGNGAGLECANGKLISTQYSAMEKEPVRYRGRRISYTIVGTHLEAADEADVEFGVDDPNARLMASFQCGDLHAPGQP